MKEILTIIVFGLIGYFIFGGGKKQEWTGFFYPDISDLSEWTTSPVFNNIESCRDWAYSQTSYNQADYECGLNCEFDSRYGVNICKETIQ